MKGFCAVALFTFIALNVSSPWHFANAEQNIHQKYKTELTVAKVVDLLIHSMRAKYTQNVVGKLRKDGTGSSVDHNKKKGFIPLPAQHVRAIADDILQKEIEEKNEIFHFFLRSAWNLNSEQGLQDSFEKKGWENLVHQQREALKAGVSYKKINWKPYVQVQDIDGRKMLRYFSADPATAIACITCHNAWEQNPEIKKLRKQQGMKAGKIFKMYELIGALSINVFINQ